ncbi:urease accessory protein UreE [Candidatus Spongiihabitans sp.]|uniref:urease accessory protein UreE n=1 Tax=Candidatus Spongiihabitans sp. TaxID=3101308 RepID=UPI003C7DE86E
MRLVRYTERVQARLEADAVKVDDCATMPFEQRQKTRLRIVLDRSGAEVGVMLPRGSVLRDGDLLRAADATIIQIIAAKEAVSTVFNEDAGLLARAAYHLGNRHVHVQIGEGWIRYLTDHVLDGMLASMGCEVTHQRVPFEPEGGAYHAHHPAHHHDHQ